MKRIIISTADGSHTVHIPEMNVTYHSKHGAVQESTHVFIEAGLRHFIATSGKQEIRIFEMGFGTGLNALLTLDEAQKIKRLINYTAIELHPLSEEERKNLDYNSDQSVFENLHAAAWEEEISIDSFFKLYKTKADLLHYKTDKKFDIIYYDAFAPSAQPQLWTADVFKKLYSMMNSGGVLVTYCSKGDVRRAMQAAGFIVEKIQGPPGKREMVRAGVPTPT